MKGKTSRRKSIIVNCMAMTLAECVYVCGEGICGNQEKRNSIPLHPIGDTSTTRFVCCVKVTMELTQLKLATSIYGQFNHVELSNKIT